MGAKLYSRCTIVVLVSFLVLNACGVQFQRASLYDGVEEEKLPDPPSNLALAVEPEIFRDDGTDFWVTEDSSCTSGYVTREVAYEGEFAIKMNWNRDPQICEWAGFGIGWDEWAAKDLSEVYDHVAIEMYVRAQEGKMFALPVVLTLEDYSGRMAWSYTFNRFFERYYIDEDWQRIVVPLNTFDLEEDGLDITNVKQLQFELQQSGGIYLDDIKLIYHEPAEKEVYEPADKLIAPSISYPILLFDDSFVNGDGWGVHSDACQTIKLSDEKPSQGNKCIHAKWDMSVEDCYYVAIGVSWNKWFSTDISVLRETGFIELDVRTNGSFSEIPVKVGFEDYERRTSFMTLDQSLTQGGYNDQWTTVRIPISSLPDTIDLQDVKQLMISMEGKGEVFIDNVRIATSKS